MEKEGKNENTSDAQDVGNFHLTETEKFAQHVVSESHPKETTKNIYFKLINNKVMGS